jgi:hypothetical protein
MFVSAFHIAQMSPLILYHKTLMLIHLLQSKDITSFPAAKQLGQQVSEQKFSSCHYYSLSSR